MENSDDKKKTGESDKSNDEDDDDEEEEDIEVESEMEEDDDDDDTDKANSKNPGRIVRLVQINKEKDIHEKDVDTIDTYDARREFNYLTNMVIFFIQIPYLVNFEFFQSF